MKPLWTQTIAWIVAAIAAFLLALATPGGIPQLFDNDAYSHGATAPR